MGHEESRKGGASRLQVNITLNCNKCQFHTKNVDIFDTHIDDTLGKSHLNCNKCQFHPKNVDILSTHIQVTLGKNHLLSFCRPDIKSAVFLMDQKEEEEKEEMDMMILDSIAKELVPTNVGESLRRKILVNNHKSPEGREASNKLRYLYSIQGKSH